MTAKKAHKKPSVKHAPPVHDTAADGHPAPVPADPGLSPIVDKRTYDRFIKAISLRVYTDFEKTLKGAGIERPELALVGLDLEKASTEMDVRMADYIALNARIMLERAFVDRNDFAARYMPRAMRQMAEDGSSDVAGYIEGKVQHDIMMEIRAIAMLHIPESERFSYISKLKVL